MKLFTYLFVFVFLLSGADIIGQEYHQTIRGSIRDADNQQLLEGVSILVLDTDLGGVSDSLGNFTLPNIPIGRHALRVSYIGYHTLVINPVILESGKETILEITLEASTSVLQSVVVSAAENQFSTACPTVRVLTNEETLKFPATFDDPARMVMSLAGVANDNDQANGLSIRGNSPNGMQWQLEGLEIVNPNHTPNAGTFSDRITQNGGGVNILSVQMLDASYFYTGAFPVEFGNAISGIMDMKLRKGNDQNHEFTGQAGLIGIELASEGPLPTQRSSYLVNYRYSTVGLLQKLGLEFGDEAISFQDLSFNLSFPFNSGARATFFGMGGSSDNNFKAKRDSSLWQFDKDGFDIDFISRMGLLGGTLSIPLSQKGSWSSAIAFSGLESQRLATPLNSDYEPVPGEKDETVQTKLSIRSTYLHKFSPNNRFRIGISLTNHYSKITSIINDQTIAYGQGSGLLFQPYLDWQYRKGKLITNLGLHYSLFTFNNSTAVEPRASVEWKVSSKNSLSLSYGLHSQLQLPQLYYSSNSHIDNSRLGLNKAHHLGTAYKQFLTDNLQLITEVFYQRLFNMAVSLDRESSFSAYNMLESFVEENLSNEGTAENYGLELSMKRFQSNDYYYLVNATVYQSKYQGSDGIKRDSRYNGNYILNAILGKSWNWTSKKGNLRSLGVNIRGNLLGGFRETPIDAESSLFLGRTVYQEDKAFSIQQKDYFRVDLRIYYQNNSPRSTGRISFDIQNLLNTQNTAFSYYDFRQAVTVQKYQLGLIPMLSYRIKI
ncbi:MAG: TonB-dependent receptor [Bacteroidetes bacterium]|nr:MAG: TonB-dependent receptor [Bacteroidota bacterium]